MQGMVLWGTEFCHLCDEARIIVGRVSETLGIPWVFRDIVDDDRALDAYRTMIPVVEVGGDILAWPFDEQGLRTWLEARRASATFSSAPAGNQLNQNQS
jgi:hypothetical protein